VLLVDELPEFQRSVLESLRQPLEDGIVAVARVGGSSPRAFSSSGRSTLHSTPLLFLPSPVAVIVLCPTRAHRSIREVDRVAPAISERLRWSGA
jgi:magnesium chelatase family protein